jgi:hypothetical protein
MFKQASESGIPLLISTQKQHDILQLIRPHIVTQLTSGVKLTLDNLVIEFRVQDAQGEGGLVAGVEVVVGEVGLVVAGDSLDALTSEAALADWGCYSEGYHSLLQA